MKRKAGPRNQSVAARQSEKFVRYASARMHYGASVEEVKAELVRNGLTPVRAQALLDKMLRAERVRTRETAQRGLLMGGLILALGAAVTVMTLTGGRASAAFGYVLCGLGALQCLRAVARLRASMQGPADRG